MGFAAPVNEWLRTDLRAFVEEHLQDSQIIRQYLNAAEVRKLFLEHTNGERNNGQLLWSLLNLALWERQFFGSGIPV